MPRNSEVHFRLKPAGPDGRSLIYLQFLFNKQRLFYSFAQRIDPAHWNASKQRVKRNTITTLDGKHSLNDLLDNLELECISAYNESLKNGIPSPFQIKARLERFMNQNKEAVNSENSLYALIDRFIKGEIKTKGKSKTKGSLQNYAAVLRHLKKFEQDEGHSVTYSNINLDFLYRYTSYLQNTLKLSPNTIAKDIRLLKVFLAEAVDLGYTNNLQFKHKKFTVAGEETDAVYLTDDELVRIHRHEFKNKKLDQVKDLFIFGSFVGLRFSDYANVKPENIITIDGELFIKIRTSKTAELVIIPCNPVVLEIFEKYSQNKNKLPKSISNQKFNDYIKDVCKEVELKEVGRLSTAPEKELWECVSSHTARRSFATNLYLNGFPSIDIMKITGHKTEKAFMKYIRITKLDTAKRLSAHIKRNWSEKLVKVPG